jgi:hypothetical protein
VLELVLTLEALEEGAEAAASDPLARVVARLTAEQYGPPPHERRPDA